MEAFDAMGLPEDLVHGICSYGLKMETFDALGLPKDLLRGIYRYGFEKPSAIQKVAIKQAMLGRDLIVEEKFGSVSIASCQNRNSCICNCATLDIVVHLTELLRPVIRYLP
jgi:hypothetical protein